MIQLFEVCESGPQALKIPASVKRFEDLYQDLELGVYTALRTFEGYKFLALDHHLQRTSDSITGMKWDYAFNPELIRKSLDQICRQDPGDKRIRIDVLAGPAEIYNSSERILIACMPFTPPDERLYRQGAYCSTCSQIERHNPKLKTAEFSLRRQAYVSRDANIHEQLLLDGENSILEGFSSNFYALHQGKLFTAADGVLEGTIRRIVLELATQADLTVVYSGTPVSALNKISEAAISSSSRGLMPVVNIDGQPIGDGQPGPIIQSLMRDFSKALSSRVKPAGEY